jgi:hypothetical protein
LDCGGCLEETAASRRRQEVSDERIERQNVLIRCRICGIGFIDEDSLAHHLRENRDCAKQYQKLLEEEKRRKPSLFSSDLDKPMNHHDHYVRFDVEYKDHDGKRQHTQVSAKDKLHAAAIVRDTLASLVLKCTPLRNGGKKC